jgi:hypothetical protein
MTSANELRFGDRFLTLSLDARFRYVPRRLCHHDGVFAAPGLRARIVNLAARMVHSARFDVEKAIAGMQSRAFGIDLHWLPMLTVHSRWRRW